MPDQEIKNTQQPVAIRQGGIGLGTVIAAVIIVAAAVYSSASGRRPKKKHPPPRNLSEGLSKSRMPLAKQLSLTLTSSFSDVVGRPPSGDAGLLLRLGTLGVGPLGFSGLSLDLLGCFLRKEIAV